MDIAATLTQMVTAATVAEAEQIAATLKGADLTAALTLTHTYRGSSATTARRGLVNWAIGAAHNSAAITFFAYDNSSPQHTAWCATERAAFLAKYAADRLADLAA